jgi:hypothetical protein
MIKKQYAGNARRARNCIWNAAGSYDFEPYFMAFHPTGEPDYYFNMIIGFARKWLDEEKIREVFESYRGAGSADEYDAYLWLGIENCVYEKELPERPHLEALRRERAEEFFRVRSRMTRQQMEYESMAVFTQEEARWSEVLGKPVHLAGKKKRMAEALHFSGELTPDEVVLKMREFLAEFCGIEPGKEVRGRTRPPLMAAVLKRLGQWRGQSEKIFVRTADIASPTDRDVQLTHTAGMRFGFAPKEADEAYVRGCFGPSFYSKADMETLENALCTGDDAACRLWVTRGADGQVPGDAEREVRDLLKRSAEQKKKNEAFRAEHALLVRESVKRLSAEVEVLLASYMRELPERDKSGKLLSEKAWRLGVLKDARVFERPGDEKEADIRVTLLLDASMSRLHSQEIVSTGAAVLAESFEKAGIPVRVISYRSIRGFTVLTRMKEFGEGGGRLSAYYSGGWNRDGLAFRTVDYLLREENPHGAWQDLLLVLTDASPNDAMPIASSGHGMGREYEGAAAVKDAENAVKLLRKNGVLTAAVFYGTAGHLESVSQIFGKEYVRIRSLNQLADGAAALLKRTLV